MELLKRKSLQSPSQMVISIHQKGQPCYVSRNDTFIWLYSQLCVLETFMDDYKYPQKFFPSSALLYVQLYSSQLAVIHALYSQLRSCTVTNCYTNRSNALYSQLRSYTVTQTGPMLSIASYVAIASNIWTCLCDMTSNVSTDTNRLVSYNVFL